MDDEVKAVTLPWMQCLKNNRTLSILLIVALIAVLIQAIVIASLFPLKEKVLQIVEFKSGSNNFVTIAKAGEDISANELITVMFLRRFIIDRETIDKITEQDRYARVMAMSSEEKGRDFQKVYGGQKSLYYKKGFKREIEIALDSRIAKGIHRIEFRTYDTYDDKKKSVTLDNNRKPTGEWIAIISYSLQSHNVKTTDIYMNPQGIVIHEYSLSMRK